MFSFLKAFAIFCLLKKNLKLKCFFFKVSARNVLSERLKPITAHVPLLVAFVYSVCSNRREVIVQKWKQTGYNKPNKSQVSLF